VEEGTLSEDEARERLERVRAKRGYLLPHHGLLAVAAPRLLDAYDAAYTALALDERTLGRHDREFVWLAILIAMDEALATHHIPKFRAAGGSDRELAAILAVTALALGGGAYAFVDRHWRAHLGGFEPSDAYADAVRRLAEGVSLRLVRLALLAVHACRGAAGALRRELVAAYAERVPEDEIAEALSLVMFPGSVPRFVEAAGVWRDAIASGAVAASPRYAAWAAMTGQGGWDEAAKARGR
jgi:alkylhydroperoxidase/carboxymuconolactone decarboxylase family protein YurZ